MVPVCSLYGSCANVPSENWERRADEKKRTCFPCALGKAAKTPLLIRFTKIKINFLISKESKSQKSSVNLQNKK